jgi:mannitol/fructose-specific phosphotransferase system IIA component (Ntr-type)
MKVLARLARKVMNEEFRARLAAENDPVELCATLQRLFED